MKDVSYKIKVNGKKEHVVEIDSAASGKIDGTDFKWDLVKIKENHFHVIKENKSYQVEIVKADYKEKNFVVKVNNNSYVLNVKDKFDQLLSSLGLDNLASVKINEVKAPMPGLVLDIRVAVGDMVQKGDPIVVLEAMKMENILKSPSDGKVKKVNVQKGVAVEKNQVLVLFE